MRAAADPVIEPPFTEPFRGGALLPRSCESRRNRGTAGWSAASGCAAGDFDRDAASGALLDAPALGLDCLDPIMMSLVSAVSDPSVSVIDAPMDSGVRERVIAVLSHCSLASGRAGSQPAL